MRKCYDFLVALLPLHWFHLWWFLASVTSHLPLDKNKTGQIVRTIELSSLFLLYTSFFNVFIFEWPATSMLVVTEFFFKSDPIHAYITTHWVDHKASKELWTQVSPLLVTFQAHISWRSSGVWGTRSLSPCFSTYTSIELLSALPMH